jgi:hypothetical protein
MLQLNTRTKEDLKLLWHPQEQIMVRKYSETHFTLRVKLHDNKADLGIACA